MASFPFADTSHSVFPSPQPDSEAHVPHAHWGTGWWRPNAYAPVRRSAPAFLPLDDHHDIDLDSKCMGTRRRHRAAGVRAYVSALRLP